MGASMARSGDYEGEIKQLRQQLTEMKINAEKKDELTDELSAEADEEEEKLNVEPVDPVEKEKGPEADTNLEKNYSKFQLRLQKYFLQKIIQMSETVSARQMQRLQKSTDFLDLSVATSIKKMQEEAP